MAVTGTPHAPQRATRRFAAVEDLRFREHRSPPGHPECPERLQAVHEALAERAGELTALPPRPAEDDEILRAHGRAHLARVREAAAAALPLDPDTYASPRSLEVARLAAGAAIDLAGAVARGDLAGGFAAVRPPGHHAEPERAMGFCLLNNVAIAARALQQQHQVDRILVVDWDVHHGNGTQALFEEDPGVLFFSTHQFPFYPGTGRFAEAGRGRGEGGTVNVPLPAGCGDAEYVGVFQRLLLPVALRYRPELVLVSCGFDAHAADPLASMQLGAEGFGALSALVRALADEVCGGRVLFVLEGGYAGTSLREGTRAVLDAMLPAAAPGLPDAVEAPAGSRLKQVVDQVVAVHGRRFPGLGAA